MKCPTCHAAYRKEESFETKDTVRTVCGCETRSQSCARKKRGSGCGTVVQAVLADDGRAEFYLCAAHAVADAVQGVEEAPATAIKKRADAARKAEAAAAQAPERHKSLPPYVHTKQWVENAIKGDVTPHVCKGCGHEFPFEASRIIMDERLFELVCPACGGDHLHYVFLDNSLCPVCHPRTHEKKEAPHGKRKATVGAPTVRR